jgi:hypothetical protein
MTPYYDPQTDTHYIRASGTFVRNMNEWSQPVRMRLVLNERGECEWQLRACSPERELRQVALRALRIAADAVARFHARG